MKLLYFAWVRQKIGVGEEEFYPPPDVATVIHLVETLRKRGGGYSEAFFETSHLQCAVNQQHANFNTSIGLDDEIAFFPPVTGG